jgi:hypothetical protein
MTRGGRDKYDRCRIADHLGLLGTELALTVGPQNASPRKLDMKWVIAFVIVLASAPFSGAQAPQGKEKLPNYYPLSPGNKWTYQVDAGDGKKVELSNQIAKTETIDGKPMARLETLLNGNVVATEHLMISTEGVFRCRYNGVEVSPPVCILKYPIKEEAMWETDTKIGGQQLKIKSSTGKFEEVTTPAGKYKTAPVVTETDVTGTTIKAKLWFAPDVGIVKQDTEFGEKKFNLELLKFDAAK